MSEDRQIERVIEKALRDYVIGDPGGATPLVIDALRKSGYAIVPVEPAPSGDKRARR